MLQSTASSPRQKLCIEVPFSCCNHRSIVHCAAFRGAAEYDDHFLTTGEVNRAGMTLKDILRMADAKEKEVRRKLFLVRRSLLGRAVERAIVIASRLQRPCPCRHSTFVCMWYAGFTRISGSSKAAWKLSGMWPTLENAPLTMRSKRVDSILDRASCLWTPSPDDNGDCGWTPTLLVGYVLLRYMHCCFSTELTDRDR
jgi:hypothetical protein